MQTEITQETRLWIHHYQHCGKQWNSEKKADLCPKCDNLNLTLSSYITEGTSE